jgi:hypothetical protein
LFVEGFAETSGPHLGGLLRLGHFRPFHGGGLLGALFTDVAGFRN